MSTTLSTESHELKRMLDVLTTVYPYPIEWYKKQSEGVINGMYRQYVNRMVNNAIARDEDDVLRRVDEAKKKSGVWSIVCINECSLRFMYLSHTNKEIHGIISTYRTKGYELAKGSKLYNDDMCITWQHGKQEIMNRTLLISKVLSSSANNPKELVQAINHLRRIK